ncbi:MAG: efflux transporter outer membrane subunit [Candidatus Accumulibacter sp.]|nr:efflux transporter outer membrane subunit [Accumulibacter sp.]
MRIRFSACLILSLLGLAACSPGPDYVRPAVDAPAAFKEAGQWKVAGGGAAAVDEKWWTVFGDPQLDALEEQVVVNNQNLKAAEAQYRAARAALDSARSAFFPTAALNAAQSRGSGSGAAAGSAGGSGATSGATSYSLSASVSWEIDVWGRIRRGVESADAKLAASAADLAAARVSTQALLAQTYAQLRAAEAQIDLIGRTLTGYRRFLELTRSRQAVGVASPLDVAQAETQLASAEVQGIDAENQRAQLEHAIAVLVGRAPAAFAIAPGARLPAVPPSPALLPSTLLERRPDIAAAERRMAAANAQIGVAGAAYFPVLDIGGSVGYRNDALAGLLSAPNRFWSLGPALAMTLFDGGARSAAVAQAGAGYDQAVATYRQTVLTAFQEVEDNLSAARLLAQEGEAQARALAAARRSREIAENQYRAGIVSSLNVVTAQAAELSAEAAAINIDSRRLQAAVLLFKNAGGLWTPPPAP